MVKKFGLTNTKRVSTPIEMNAQFLMQQCPSTPNQVAHMNRISYSEAIGLVLWPTVVSQPDTAYAIGILSQFMQNLGMAHWEGVKHVISYLGSTKDFWLTFGSTKRNVADVKASVQTSLYKVHKFESVQRVPKVSSKCLY